MAINIGPKIGVEGESEYKKQLQGIIEKSKSLNAEMEAVSKGFRDAGDDSTDFEKKAEVLGRQIKNQQEIIDGYKNMLDLSAKATGENSTETSQYETKLYKAQGRMADLQKQLEGLTGEEDTNEKQTEDVGDSVEDLGKDMDDTKEKTSIFADTLKSQLTAQAIIEGIKTIAGAVKEIAGSVKEAFTSTVDWADELETLSKQTGVSTTQLQKWEYMSGLVDTDVSTITGSLSKLTKSMDSASGGTGATADAFNELGVKVTDAKGNLRDNEEVFYEVIDALGAIKNPTERDAKAMEIFGKSAKELNPLIMEGSENLKAFGDEAMSTGYVLPKGAITQLSSLSDSFERIKNSGDSAIRGAIAPLAPAISNMVDQAIPSIQEFSQNVSQMFAGNMTVGDFTSFMMEKLNGLVTWVNENMPKFVSVGTEIIVSILNGLAEGDIAGQAMSIVSTLLTSLSENMPQLIEAGLNLIMSLIEGLTDPANVTMLIDSGLNLVVSIVTGLVEALPQILEKAPEIISNLVQGLVESLPILIENGITLINALIEGIMNTLPLLMSQGSGLLGTIVTGIVNAIPQLIKTAPQLITQFISSIAQNLPQILASGITILTSLIAGLVSAIPDLIASIPEIISAIVDTFKQTDWKSLGIQVIQGLINGIKSTLSSAVQEMKKVGTKLYETAKNFFKIGSPSKLFRDEIGKMIPAGLEQGIDQGMPAVIKDMEDQMSGLVFGASASLEGATAVATGGTSSTMNYGGFTINVNAQDGQSARDIADEVMYRIQSAVNRREAVFA